MSATRAFVIDNAHSEATFQVRHLVTKVRGRFTDLDGTIQIDEAQPEQSSVAFTIQAARSVGERDDRIRDVGDPQPEGLRPDVERRARNGRVPGR